MKDTTETALMVPSKDIIAHAFDSDEKVMEIIAAIEAECRAEVLTADTKEGRERIKSRAYSISRSKTFMDDVGKGLTEEARKIVDAVNSRRKIVVTRLDALRDEIRAPLTAWEEAEKKRQQAIKDKITDLFGMRALPTTSAALIEIQTDVTAIELDDQFGEFVDEAAKAKDAFLRHLSVKLQDALQSEAREAELARLREAEAQRKAQEAELAEQNRIKDEEIAALKAQLAAKPPVIETNTGPVINSDTAPVTESETVIPIRSKGSEERPAEQPKRGDNFVTVLPSEAPADTLFNILRESIHSVLRDRSSRVGADALARAILNNEIPYVRVSE